MWFSRQDQKPTFPPPSPSAPPASPSALTETPVETSGQGESRITRSLCIKGEVDGREDLRVDGRVEGPMRLAGGRVTVGEGGAVSGPIEAHEIVVHGAVRGTLRATDRIEIGAAGVLQGDLVAQRLSVVEGARVRGRVVMGAEEEPGKRAGHTPRESKPTLFPAPGAKAPASEQ